MTTQIKDAPQIFLRDGSVHLKNSEGDVYPASQELAGIWYELTGKYSADAKDIEQLQKLINLVWERIPEVIGESLETS